jgi:hypothetical protein
MAADSVRRNKPLEWTGPRSPSALQPQVACLPNRGSARGMETKRLQSKAGISAYSRHVPTQTRVQKWGNSLGVRIPRNLAEQIGLAAGSAVSLSAKNGELVVKPALPT